MSSMHHLTVTLYIQAGQNVCHVAAATEATSRAVGVAKELVLTDCPLDAVDCNVCRSTSLNTISLLVSSATGG